MNKKTRIAAIVLGLLLIVIAFDQALQTGHATSQSGVEAVAASCQTNVTGGVQVLQGSGNPLSPTGQEEIAFLMPSNSVAELCVSYSLSTGAIGTGGSSIPLAGSVYAVTAVALNNTNNEGYGYSYSYSTVPAITVTASPSTLSTGELASMKNITVVYTITASGDTTGDFGLSLTNSCPSLIPFAVGVGAVSSASFTGFPELTNCVVHQPLSGAILTGYTGLSTSTIEGSG